MQQGVLRLPLQAEQHFTGAGFSKQFERRTREAIDQRNEFTVGEGRFYTFVRWNPTTRFRGQLQLRIFDAENQLVIASKPSGINLSPGASSGSQWQLDVPPMPGTYRADVVLDGNPVWRGFLRVR